MHTDGVMVSLLGRGRLWVRALVLVKPDNNIGTCNFAAKHTALRSKSKDWWVWNQNTCNVMTGAMLQAAVLICEFYSTLTHFCDKGNILNVVMINEKIIKIRSKKKTS